MKMYNRCFLKFLICFSFCVKCFLGNPDLLSNFNSRAEHKDCTNEVNVRLGFPTMQTDVGIVEISTFKHSNYSYVCYASNEFDVYSSVTMLAHVVCRQLGYMTFFSRVSQKLLVQHSKMNFNARSFGCMGHEQSLYQCRKNGYQLQKCTHVLAVQCDSCYHSIYATKGVITNPGYPHAYLYTVFCEWKVTVPEDFYIILQFQHFELPAGNHSALGCSGMNPFIEISYSLQTAVVVEKYCFFHHTKTLKVPHHSFKLRFYSGVYQKVQRNRYGFNILFKVESKYSSSTSLQPLKLIFIIFGILVFFGILICCFWCRRKNVKEQEVPETSCDLERCFKHGQLTKLNNTFTISPGNAQQHDNNYCSFDIYSSNTSPDIHVQRTNADCSQVEHAKNSYIHVSQTPFGVTSAAYDNKDIGKLSRLRTTLLSKFTPSQKTSQSSENTDTQSESSQNGHYLTQKIGFNIYRSFELSPNSVQSKDINNVQCINMSCRTNSCARNGTLLPGMPGKENLVVPSIVVELVDDSTPT